MCLHHQPARQGWRLPVLAFKKFTEQEAVVSELARTFVCRKQTRQLVAEARHARWFQSDDRHAARQIRSQCIKNACELVLRQIEHALGIQRTLTTQLPLRDTDPIAGRFEHAYCSAQGLGRSEEHTSELQSLMRISYAVFCLKKKTKNTQTETNKSK